MGRDGWAKRTRATVVVTTVALVVYDAVVYAVDGGRATLSSVVGGWLTNTLVVPVLVGGLVGHLLASGDRPPSPGQWTGFVAAGVTLYGLTRWSPWAG